MDEGEDEHTIVMVSHYFETLDILISLAVSFYISTSAEIYFFNERNKLNTVSNVAMQM